MMQIVSRSDLVLLSFWMLTIPGTFLEPKKPDFKEVEENLRTC